MIAIELETLQHPKRANQDAKSVMTRRDAKTGVRLESPYRAKNLDGAITHLEFAVAVDGNIAGYWLDRVRRIASTPQIVPAQARRLQSLLDQLKDVSAPAAR
jgi:hypothetical protein